MNDVMLVLVANDKILFLMNSLEVWSKLPELFVVVLNPFQALCKALESLPVTTDSLNMRCHQQEIIP